MFFGRYVAALLAGVVMMFGFCDGADAAPRAELWERWTRHDPAGTLSLSHRQWDEWLSRHVRTAEDGIARIAYGKVDTVGRTALEAYLAQLEAVPVDALSRTEQLAFWVNLYNALTVRVVLDHSPVDSIRDIDISPGFFADGPWGRKLAKVEGIELSLDDIEHRILRPIWRDPRIHYAVNCASLGCPNLQARAMTADNAAVYLDDGARDFINHPRGARIEDGKLYTSSIYDWFEEDFGGSDVGVIAHLRHYARPPLAAALKRISRISGDSYDWRLNDAK